MLQSAEERKKSLGHFRKKNKFFSSGLQIAYPRSSTILVISGGTPIRAAENRSDARARADIKLFVANRVLSIDKPAIEAGNQGLEEKHYAAVRMARKHQVRFFASFWHSLADEQVKIRHSLGGAFASALSILGASNPKTSGARIGNSGNDQGVSVLNCDQAMLVIEQVNAKTSDRPHPFLRVPVIFMAAGYRENSVFGAHVSQWAQFVKHFPPQYRQYNRRSS